MTDDKNRELQADRALEAFEDGYDYAIRHAQFDSCEECAAKDGEIVPISDVIEMKSDHYRGHCTYEFVKAGEVEDEEKIQD
jgi:hypothetical protein